MDAVNVDKSDNIRGYREKFFFVRNIRPKLSEILIFFPKFECPKFNSPKFMVIDIDLSKVKRFYKKCSVFYLQSRFPLNISLSTKVYYLRF